jgi:hypothetical protein
VHPSGHFFTVGKNLAIDEQCKENFETYQNFTRSEIQGVLKKINRPDAKILSICKYLNEYRDLNEYCVWVV